MAFRPQIRFQTWVLAMTVLLVLSLAAAFLVTVFRTFAYTSEESAEEHFALMAEQARLQLENLVQQSAKLVVVRAGAAKDVYVKNGGLNRDSEVTTFWGSLAADPNVYSHFFALANEEFLQVISTGGDARTLVALQAPEGTHFVVRRITLDKRGGRSDSCQFFTKGKALLGSRSKPAELVPSQRPWYQGALAKGGLFVTTPYVFASTSELGLTVAAPLAGGGGVLATDISLRSLEQFLTRIKLPPNGAIALQDTHGKVIAFRGIGRFFGEVKIAPLSEPGQLDSPYLSVLRADAPLQPSMAALGPQGERFVVNVKTFAVTEDAVFRITVWAPFSDFTAVFNRAQNDVMLLAVVVLLVLVPVAFQSSRKIGKTLTAMAADSERLKRLDFSQEPHKTESILYEVQALGDAQTVMHEAVRQRTEELRNL